MPTLVNWELLKQPYNWIVVFIMCIFALLFLSLAFPQATNSEA